MYTVELLMPPGSAELGRLPFMDKITFAKHKVLESYSLYSITSENTPACVKNVSSSFRFIDKKQVFHYINKLGFTFIIDKGSSIKPLPSSLKQRITDQCLQEEHQKTVSLSKLKFDQVVFDNFEGRSYVDVFKRELERSVFSSLKLRSQYLAIEKVRHRR